MTEATLCTFGITEPAPLHLCVASLEVLLENKSNLCTCIHGTFRRSKACLSWRLNLSEVLPQLTPVAGAVVFILGGALVIKAKGC